MMLSGKSSGARGSSQGTAGTFHNSRSDRGATAPTEQQPTARNGRADADFARMLLDEAHPLGRREVDPATPGFYYAQAPYPSGACGWPSISTAAYAPAYGAPSGHSSYAQPAYATPGYGYSAQPSTSFTFVAEPKQERPPAPREIESSRTDLGKLKTLDAEDVRSAEFATGEHSKCYICLRRMVAGDRVRWLTCADQRRGGPTHKFHAACIHPHTGKCPHCTSQQLIDDLQYFA